MGTVDRAVSLLEKKKYKESALLLDKELKKRNNDRRLWYLRSLVSLNLNNFEYALECINTALMLKKDARFYKLRGLIYLQNYLFEDAVENFKISFEMSKDSETAFYLSITGMFLSIPDAGNYLSYAYKKDKEKTKKMLLSFYRNFMSRTPDLSENEKKALLNNIKRLK
ncbi:hypothetical protein JXB01_00460 [Candidatus Micrarchaeota archaeon]|nr:hypothetical protein [Candidatus Micrarchaeota archaeon]